MVYYIEKVSHNTYNDVIVRKIEINKTLQSTDKENISQIIHNVDTQ